MVIFILYFVSVTSETICLAIQAEYFRFIFSPLYFFLTTQIQIAARCFNYTSLISLIVTFCFDASFLVKIFMIVLGGFPDCNFHTLYYVFPYPYGFIFLQTYFNQAYS